jgi:predicted ester cyclase
VAPTGNDARWAAAEIYQVTDGKIKQRWLVEDWTSVLV